MTIKKYLLGTHGIPLNYVTNKWAPNKYTLYILEYGHVGIIIHLIKRDFTWQTHFSKFELYNILSVYTWYVKIFIDYLKVFLLNVTFISKEVYESN